MGGASYSFFLLFLIASGVANPVCDFTIPHEPKWVSAAFILAETIVDYIPSVGPWAGTQFNRKSFDLSLEKWLEIPF